MISWTKKKWPGFFRTVAEPDSAQGLQVFFLGRLFIGFFLLMLVTVQQISRHSNEIQSLLLAYAILAVLFGFSLITGLLASRNKLGGGIGLLHVPFDVLALSIWLSLANAPSSPVIFIYLVIVLLASLVFLTKGALISAFSASACYFYVLLTTLGISTDSVLSWGIYTLIFGMVGLVGGFLSEELKRASEGLQQKSREIEQLTRFYEGIVEGMPTGLLTLDENMVVAFINPGAESILNKKSIEVVGRSLKTELPDLLPFFETIPAQKIEDESDDLTSTGLETELTSTGTEWHRSVFLKATLGRGEARLQQTVELGNGKNKRLLRGDVAVINIGAGVGNLFSKTQGVGRVLLFQDVTKLVHLEDKLKQHEKLAAVGQLAAGIAHEIRNPLASMSASIQMLQTSLEPKALEAENRRLMEIIVKEVDRLNELISDFLDFVKPEKLKMESVDLEKLLSEVILQVSSQKDKMTAFEIRKAFVPGILAMGSEEKLKQVVWNLLTNAIQAMKHPGEIEMGCESVSPHWVCFWVKDSGEGMSEEVLQHLYEPFFTTKPRGTGLGLATVYKIIEAHHGEIRVQSQIGHGTRFEIHLPKA